LFQPSKLKGKKDYNNKTIVKFVFKLREIEQKICIKIQKVKGELKVIIIFEGFRFLLNSLVNIFRITLTNIVVVDAFVETLIIYSKVL